MRTPSGAGCELRKSALVTTSRFALLGPTRRAIPPVWLRTEWHDDLGGERIYEINSASGEVCGVAGGQGHAHDTSGGCDEQIGLVPNLPTGGETTS